MPQIGEIKQLKEIWPQRQLNYDHGFQRYIWLNCPECGRERWVDFYNAKKSKGRCQSCATKDYKGVGNPYWRGGCIRDSQGYLAVKIYSDNFFYPMASQIGYIKEHRLVMARHLGRCLQSWEIVHHKNGDKDDNRIENLELVIRGQHARAHGRGYRDGYEKGYRDGQTVQTKELKQEIRLLRLELRELKHTPGRVFEEVK